VAAAEEPDPKPWLERQWVIPPEASAGFVAAMEDVLDTSARPHDPARPVVRVGEGGKRLLGDVRPPLPVRPGSPAEEDGEDVRGGVANLFPAFEPLTGRRHGPATGRTTAKDFARFLRAVSDDHYRR
jgi:hypothetical protein